MEQGYRKTFHFKSGNKGTDNAFSLEPQGSKNGRDISRAKIAPDGVKKQYDSEIEPLRKMATSINLQKNLEKGVLNGRYCIQSS